MEVPYIGVVARRVSVSFLHRAGVWEVTSSFRPVVPSEHEENTRGTPSEDPLSPPAHNELSSDDEGTLFSSTTTVEICSSDGSRTLIATDSGPSQSYFVASNSHTTPVLAPGVTDDQKLSSRNKSANGTSEQSGVFKFKLFNRSLPRLVSTPKQPSLHSFYVRVPVGANQE